jgi:DNA polymerase
MTDAEKTEVLGLIAEHVKECAECALRHKKHAPVPGVGPADAQVMIIGEAAGETEIKEGQPFVGKAGFLLNQCLQEAGWNRKDIYITNVVRCRPTNGTSDRAPLQREIKECSHFLMDEIATIKPKLVILLGNTPLGLFSRKSKISEARGKPFEVD